MELREFIAKTLQQIIDGVSDVQEYAGERGGIIGDHPRNSPRTQNVEFDVAVTTQDGTQAKGGAGLFVGPVGIGTNLGSDRSNQSVSRIKFSVPLFLPRQKK